MATDPASTIYVIIFFPYYPVTTWLPMDLLISPLPRYKSKEPQGRYWAGEKRIGSCCGLLLPRSTCSHPQTISCLEFSITNSAYSSPQPASTPLCQGAHTSDPNCDTELLNPIPLSSISSLPFHPTFSVTVIFILVRSAQEGSSLPTGAPQHTTLHSV